MSGNSVELNTLVQAVGEDPRLGPIEKGTHLGWTKDGYPTTAATQFNQHVARVFSEEAGICRRLLQHPHFTVTGIRVNDSLGEARSIAPDNFCGGRVTAVGGYIPIGTVKLQKTCRSGSGHAPVVSYQRETSNSSQTPSSAKHPNDVSGSVSQEETSDDSTEVNQTAGDDSETSPDQSDLDTNNPLRW